MSGDNSHGESEFKSTGGVARIAKATRYSMQGLSHAFTHEAAFRQELLLVVPLLTALPFARVSLLENLFVIVLGVAVLVVEILNSAIEAVVDRVSLEQHPLAGRAKDLGSAAVLLTISTFVVSWLLIVGVPLWQRLAS
ncbi:MAG: diacylglycerol kinase [Casimicrobium sp.]